MGARALTSVEAGGRWLPKRRWSFYTGAGFSGDFSLMTRPGTDIVQLRTLNDVDGVGGRVGRRRVPPRRRGLAARRRAIAARRRLLPGGAARAGDLHARRGLRRGRRGRALRPRMEPHGIARGARRADGRERRCLARHRQSIDHAGISADVRKISERDVDRRGGGYSRARPPRLCGMPVEYDTGNAPTFGATLSSPSPSAAQEVRSHERARAKVKWHHRASMVAF